jgi:hypothetical protein
MKRFLFPLLLFTLLAPLFASGSAQAQDTDKRARRWRVMVIVPETHLYKPRIPDPAVETMLSKQLIDAGYKVVDQGRISDLRYSRVMDRILQGGPASKVEVIRLGRRFGADVLITGEAFSQLVTRQNVTTDLGPVDEIRCRARVELRGIRMDTGEKIYADSIQKTGSADSTEELASKACLEQAAEDISAGLLDKLGKLAFSGSRQIEVSIRGLGSQSQALQLEQVLSALPGVQDVSPGDFDASTDETEVTVGSSAARTFTSSSLMPRWSSPCRATFASTRWTPFPATYPPCY